MTPLILGSGALLALIGIVFFLALCFRVVVPTNEVHIVQSSTKRVSYGRSEKPKPGEEVSKENNTYWKWPAFVPIVGVRVTTLPMAVFDVDLSDYAAYDKGRLPFQIDIMAFFRVVDTNLAAQRVNTVAELKMQLAGILQGACRTILASSEIETILEGRSEFGKMFTTEVDHQLESWGVQSVKQIELMDIRDAQGSKVIANIMEKKKSEIDRESRVTVADNKQKAEIAETLAQQAIDIQKQEAAEKVGIRTAEQKQKVGIANEQANQHVQEQVKETKTKEMAVLQVQQVRQAEINKEVNIVVAEQKRQTDVIDAEAARQVAIVKAEGEKQQTITVAEGNLSQAKLNAEGIKAEGEAKGAAETAILMAPIATQITLAKEIGQNVGYQKYLVDIRIVEKDETVGVEQAKALTQADIKVIVNSGNVTSGMNGIADVFSSKGGTNLGAMAEAMAQTPAGKAVLSAVGVNLPAERKNGATGLEHA